MPGAAPGIARRLVESMALAQQAAAQTVTDAVLQPTRTMYAKKPITVLTSPKPKAKKADAKPAAKAPKPSAAKPAASPAGAPAAAAPAPAAAQALTGGAGRHRGLADERGTAARRV